MADEKLNDHAPIETPLLNPALKKLVGLIGKWDVELRFPVDPPGAVHAEALFEWLA